MLVNSICLPIEALYVIYFNYFNALLFSYFLQLGLTLSDWWKIKNTYKQRFILVERLKWKMLTNRSNYYFFNDRLSGSRYLSVCMYMHVLIHFYIFLTTITRICRYISLIFSFQGIYTYIVTECVYMTFGVINWKYIFWVMNLTELNWILVIVWISIMLHTGLFFRISKPQKGT